MTPEFDPSMLAPSVERRPPTPEEEREADRAIARVMRLPHQGEREIARRRRQLERRRKA